MITFTNLIQLSNNFTNEDVCRKYLEEIIWNGKPVCPFCGSFKHYSFKDGKTYKCAEKVCRKKFNIKIGTFLESSKLPFCKWFHAIYVFTSHKKGISSCQLAKDIGITQKSAWFVLSRIREILRDKAAFMLDGITEIDETYIGGKLINKHAKQKEKILASANPDNKQIVLGLVQREGKALFTHIPDTESKTLFKVINTNVKKGSSMVTDGLAAYRKLKKQYQHSFVDHSKGEYVRGASHTNTVEGAFSQLKRGIYGIYHQVSPKHLHRYCNEFAFRYSTRKETETNRFDIALKQSLGRLKYADLIKKKIEKVERVKKVYPRKPKVYKPNEEPSKLIFPHHYNNDKGSLM